VKPQKSRNELSHPIKIASATPKYRAVFSAMAADKEAKQYGL
jgi:hypothetical protein